MTCRAIAYVVFGSPLEPIPSGPCHPGSFPPLVLKGFAGGGLAMVGQRCKLLLCLRRGAWAFRTLLRRSRAITRFLSRGRGLSASGLPSEVVPQALVLEDGPVRICAQPPLPTAKVVSASGQYALIASRDTCDFTVTL